MYGIFYIRPVSVGLDSQIWYLFIHITGYLNVRKISETVDFRTFVGPLKTIDIYYCCNRPVGSDNKYNIFYNKRKFNSKR